MASPLVVAVCLLVGCGVVRPTDRSEKSYTVTTLAGVGSVGNRDGPATAAAFAEPQGLAVDAGGNLFIADTGNAAVRALWRDSSIVETLPSTMFDAALQKMKLVINKPTDVAIDQSGAVYIADLSSPQLFALVNLKGDWTPEARAGSGQWGKRDGPASTAQFEAATSIAVDAQNAVYLTGSDSLRVLKNGMVSTIAGAQLRDLAGVAVDQTRGRVYLSSSSAHEIFVVEAGKVRRFAGGLPGFRDGPLGEARFLEPAGLAITSDGTVIVADAGNRRIRAIANGRVYTVAGNGFEGAEDGWGNAATFYEPRGVAVGADDTIYVADTAGSQIRRLELR